MTDTTFRMSLDGDASALAVILGTNEIASAAAVHLARRCHHVIPCNDPFPPVIRRGMAFHDALFEDRIEVDGLRGVCAETARKGAWRRSTVAHRRRGGSAQGRSRKT